MADIDALKNTIEVKLDKYPDDIFIFRVPNIADEIRLGVHSRDLRVKMSPNSNPFEGGIDYGTTLMLRACATFELLLSQTSATWVAKDDKGSPKIDSLEFPPERTEEIIDVVQAFNESLTTFRQKRIADRKPPSKETVAS